MRTQHTSVEAILNEEKIWKDELIRLREIMLTTGLKEEIKWGGPIYTWEGKNVVAIGGFKNFFTIWFHQGVFLSDPLQVLVNAGEGRTRGLRQWRFTSIQDIKPTQIKQYVKEALQNAKEGKEIKPAAKKEMAMPVELKRIFTSRKEVKTAFEKLTPGRQREYLEYVGEAKTEATRERRAEKAAGLILQGLGLNEQYKGR